MPKTTTENLDAINMNNSPQKPDKKKPRRRYLRADERRESIIKAAQEVFSRTTLQGARTRELAKAAGVNQATLYGHFDSKEALFIEAVVQPMVEAMHGIYDRAQSLEKAANKEEFLTIATNSAKNHLDSMSKIFPLLTSALFSDPELGAKLYCEHISPMLDERAKFTASTVQEEFDPRAISLFAFGMFFAVALDAYFRGESGDNADIAEQLTRFSAFGFAKDAYRQ